MQRTRLVDGARAALLALVVVCGSSVLAACAGGSPAGPSPADASYLASVHDSAPDVGTYRSDTSLVRLGHAVCDGFKAGASYEQLADRLALQEGTESLPSDDLGAVITAAVQSYCPQFTSLVQ